MNKVVEFVRVSTKEQANDDRAGLPRQREANALTVKKHNLNVIDYIELTDISGTSVMASTGMDKLISYLKSGAVKGVVVADLDRLCRLDDFRNLGFLQVFKETGTLIYLPDNVIDVNTQSGFFMGGILSILGGNELTQIKKRMLEAKEIKRMNGEHPNNDKTLPLGVAYDREQRKYYYTDEIYKIKNLFRLFHDDGIQNFRELERATGIKHRTIANLLHNEIFIGYRTYRFKRSDEKRTKPGGKQGDRKKIKSIIKKDLLAVEGFYMLDF